MPPGTSKGKDPATHGLVILNVVSGVLNVAITTVKLVGGLRFFQEKFA